MTTTIEDLLLHEISDEAAYQLVDLFYSLAVAFETIHFGKIMRYRQSLTSASQNPLRPWESQSPDLQDPPF